MNSTLSLAVAIVDDDADAGEASQWILDQTEGIALKDLKNKLLLTCSDVKDLVALRTILQELTI